MTLDLPLQVWHTVLSSLRFQREKLEGKADRSKSQITIDRTMERATNLAIAIHGIEAKLEIEETYRELTNNDD